MCIVNIDGCNIFENLFSKDYITVLDLVRDIILVIDFVYYFKIMNSFKEMAKGKRDFCWFLWIVLVLINMYFIVFLFI